MDKKSPPTVAENVGEIASFSDLLDWFDYDPYERAPVKQTPEQQRAWIARMVYDRVDCGPWVEFCPEGITIGSIVEGTDAAPESRWLPYPFSSDQLTDALRAVNEDASALWEAGHGG